MEANESSSPSEPCLACGATSWKQKRVWWSQDSRIFQCSTCQLSRADELSTGSPDEVGEAKSSRTEPAFYHGLVRSFDEQAAFASTIVPLRLKAYEGLVGRPVESILEVGCGTAQYFRAFSEAGVRWLGSEINPEMQAHAESVGAPLRDLAALVAAGDQFDVVFMSQVLEHILAPAEFLGTVRTLLKPDGLLHVDVPNHDSLVATIRKWLPFGTDYGFIQQPHHQIAYNERALEAVLHRHGFTCLDVRAISNSHPVYGQLVSDTGLKQSALHFAGRCGVGSLLLGLAQPLAGAGSQVQPGVNDG